MNYQRSKDCQVVPNGDIWVVTWGSSKVKGCRVGWDDKNLSHYFFPHRNSYLCVTQTKTIKLKTFKLENSWIWHLFTFLCEQILLKGNSGRGANFFLNFILQKTLWCRLMCYPNRTDGIKENLEICTPYQTHYTTLGWKKFTFAIVKLFKKCGQFHRLYSNFCLVAYVKVCLLPK